VRFRRLEANNPLRPLSFQATGRWPCFAKREKKPIRRIRKRRADSQ